MDQWLANIYGTGGSEDLEKTAQHMLLQKLAEEEGVSLDGMTEDQLTELAAQVGIGAEEEVIEEPVVEAPVEGGYQAAPADQEMLAKEAQAKFEEADFLGRVMAHSYNNELEKIAGAREFAGRAGAAVKGAVGAARGRASQAAGAAKDMAHRGNLKALKYKMKGRAAVEQNRGKAGLAAGAVAGAGAGFAAGRAGRKEKTASAFEKLAEMRAAEILTQHGIDPATGAPAQQAQQPQVSPEEQFGQALDSRALEILAQHGYDVSGIADEVGGDDAGGDIDGGQGQVGGMQAGGAPGAGGGMQA
jgi:hypothetical protein